MSAADEPIELAAPRLRWIFYAVGAFLVAGFSGGLSTALDPESRSFLVLPAFIAVMGIAFVLVALRPGRLRITRDGFAYTAPLRRGAYRWSDIARFGVYLAIGGENVGFDFASDYRGARPRAIAADARGGFAASLPGTYGRDARALADLLERRRIAARSAFAGSR